MLNEIKDYYELIDELEDLIKPFHSDEERAQREIGLLVEMKKLVKSYDDL